MEQSERFEVSHSSPSKKPVVPGLDNETNSNVTQKKTPELPLPKAAEKPPLPKPIIDPSAIPSSSYNTNERVESILQKINEINSRDTISFSLIKSEVDNSHQLEYDYRAPLLSETNNQIII